MPIFTLSQKTLYHQISAKETIKSAQNSAEAMSKKHNTHFSYYKCLFCDGYHIGKNRDNKTDYDKNN